LIKEHAQVVFLGCRFLEHFLGYAWQFRVRRLGCGRLGMSEDNGVGLCAVRSRSTFEVS
jgi:hypothetical protein